MFKTNILALLTAVLTFTSQNAAACSVYSSDQSHVMAANYDWTVSGGLIFNNGWGSHKKAFLKNSASAPAAEWTVRYASLTLSQWGREFPMQGINTSGLTGVVLNAPAHYAPATSSQKLISEMQWLQYQLDNYATVVEVAAHLPELAIQKLNADLHFFLCDARKDCGLVEFTAEGAVIYRDSDLNFRAITNSNYGTSLKAWRDFESSNPSEKNLPAGYASLNRLVRAAWFAQQPLGDDLAHLKNLAGSGWTQWHSIFDTAKRSVSVTPIAARASYEIPFTDYSRHCKWASQMREITVSGVSPWTKYNDSVSAEQLTRAAEPIVATFPKELQERMIAYATAISCPD